MKNNILKLTKPPTEPPELQAEETKLEFLDVSDLAKLLKCSVPTARGIMHRRDFPLLTIGRKMLVMKKAFEKWAMERRE